MKPLFIFERIDTATLAASAGSDANYPLTNLQDGRYATRWKSGGTAANQTLTITFTAAKATNCILIFYHNLNLLGLTSLYVIDNTGDPLVTVESFSSVIYLEWDVLSAGVIGLKFVKGSALSFAPEIGMIFVGKKVELPGVLNNPKKGFITNTDMDESLSGLPFATQTQAGRYTRKLTLDGLSTADEVEFDRLLNSVSNRLHPFFLRDTDGNWNFVRIGQDVVERSTWSKIKSFPQELLLVGEMPGVQFII